jgi:hypothetical protein
MSGAQPAPLSSRYPEISFSGHRHISRHTVHLRPVMSSNGSHGGPIKERRLSFHRFRHPDGPNTRALTRELGPGPSTSKLLLRHHRFNQQELATPGLSMTRQPTLLPPPTLRPTSPRRGAAPGSSTRHLSRLPPFSQAPAHHTSLDLRPSHKHQHPTLPQFPTPASTLSQLHNGSIITRSSFQTLITTDERTQDQRNRTH